MYEGTMYDDPRGQRAEVRMQKWRGKRIERSRDRGTEWKERAVSRCKK